MTMTSAPFAIFLTAGGEAPLSLDGSCAGGGS